ncbi:Hpt domain-containing protein [Agaribacterium haliotis]|uniref:Hpt domain-containing protein n=1 Tax=Agaribacterium haliotis TaxID=2013869 RepID=UPI000BB56B3B|nr:Hpt domain-containing protein [Agaribacterium haliotis]
MSEQMLLDQAMLHQLKDLLGEKFETLVTAFIDDGGKRLERLSLAVTGPEFHIVRAEAHGLKGSCRNIGANALADICADIENAAQKEDASNLAPNLASALQMFADVCEQLRRVNTP